jgi:hypothetical protein
MTRRLVTGETACRQFKIYFLLKKKRNKFLNLIYILRAALKVVE